VSTNRHWTGFSEPARSDRQRDNSDPHRHAVHRRGESEAAYQGNAALRKDGSLRHRGGFTVLSYTFGVHAHSRSVLEFRGASTSRASSSSTASNGWAASWRGRNGDRHHPRGLRHRAAGERRDLRRRRVRTERGAEGHRRRAALGGPMVLATISYAVVGFAMLWNHRAWPHHPNDRMRFAAAARDQTWFLCLFAGKVALGLIAFSYKPWLGAYFCWRTRRTWCASCAGAGHRRGEPGTAQAAPEGRSGLAVALIQTTLALIAIAFASKVFVGNWKPSDLAGCRRNWWRCCSARRHRIARDRECAHLGPSGKERLALANISGHDDSGHVPTASLVLHHVDIFARSDRLGAITLAAWRCCWCCSPTRR